jgi:hypothetical protein
VKPEEALAAARQAAAAARARGAYGDDLSGMRVEPIDRVDTEQLMEWAVIEPDLDLVRSTRRMGGPITWAKRGLVHALRQYHGQVLATQARFNVHLMVYLAELEDRIEALEKAVSAGEPTPLASRVGSGEGSESDPA